METKKRAFRALINTIIHSYALFVKMLQRKQLLSGAHPRFSATHAPSAGRAAAQFADVHPLVSDLEQFDSASGIVGIAGHAQVHPQPDAPKG